MSAKFLQPSMEGSKLLEAALQQMDGIIAGAQLELSSLPDRSMSPPISVIPICEKLKQVIQQNQDENELDEVDERTREYLIQWLTGGQAKDIELRLSRLEDDKSSLLMQVSVLSDQIDAQTETIRELEDRLEDRKDFARKAEEERNKEILLRSSLETQRLELLSEVSTLRLKKAAQEREIQHMRDTLNRFMEAQEVQQQQVQCDIQFSPTASSTPLHSFYAHDAARNRQLTSPTSSTSLSCISPSPNSSSQKYDSIAEGVTLLGMDSSTDRKGLMPKTPPPNSRSKLDSFPTMPRSQKDLIMPVGLPPQGSMSGSFTAGRPKGVMFAETERDDTICPPNPPLDMQRGTLPITQRSPSLPHKQTTIKKIFTKLRRSSSGHLESNPLRTPVGDLKRGGIRATASARLGWNAPAAIFREPEKPFTEWSSTQIESWVSHLGLNQYATAARCWTSAGHRLHTASASKIEKDLGVRHPLHRKKLQLAILSRLEDPSRMGASPVSPSTSSSFEVLKPCSQLDSSWVLRWLDDLGLPQYKDAFSESRVDGAVLNYLTYDDLSFLKISNVLHITSLRRGIEVLRLYKFDPNILKRRSSPAEDSSPPFAEEVFLWTNHRVMEWLKTVDLSEYAPNLRGSGVHGALMANESRFTSELLASLLAISSNKTLLRRHLNTHFNVLIGKDCVAAKRQAEVEAGFSAITIAAKIKMPKKSQFSLKRRKTRSDVDMDDLVCPEKGRIGNKSQNREISLESNE